VKYSFEGTGADGTALAYSFTVKYDGKDVPVTGSGMPYGADHIAIKRVDSHTFSATLQKANEVVATTRAWCRTTERPQHLLQKAPTQWKWSSILRHFEPNRPHTRVPHTAGPAQQYKVSRNQGVVCVRIGRPLKFHCPDCCGHSFMALALSLPLSWIGRAIYLRAI
jgi:hypothetical protein